MAMIMSVLSGLSPPVYIDTGRSRVTQGRLQGKESTYLVAKLAFHAKESPIRTQVQSSVFVSSQPIRLAHG